MNKIQNDATEEGKSRVRGRQWAVYLLGLRQGPYKTDKQNLTSTVTIRNITFQHAMKNAENMQILTITALSMPLPVGTEMKTQRIHLSK